MNQLLMTNPFAEVEFVEQVVAGVPFNVLGLVAGVLESAAIELNNAGINLPADEWRALREQCDRLTTMSEMYAKAAVGQLDLTEQEASR